jgi:hypothetical protein
MTRKAFQRVLVLLAFVAAVAFVSCGDDESSSGTTGSTASTTEPATTQPATTSPTTAPETTTPATTEPATTVPATTVAPSTAPPTTSIDGLEQPAIWPAADVVFTTPEAAAADFVEQLLGVPPVLGEFMGGDARSGEIEVFSPGDGGPGPSEPSSTLLLRQLGPDDGWFVLAAVQPMVSIDTPAQGDTVAAAPLDVAGTARGYEATILVTAAIAGTTTLLDDPAIAMGGALGTPEPYAATVDLSTAPAGSIVTILVRGDTGLENDPGEFSAIAVVIAG